MGYLELRALNERYAQPIIQAGRAKARPLIQTLRGKMHWSELAVAAFGAAVFTAFYFFPGDWCEPMSVRFIVGAFIVITGAFYLWLVDDERRPKASAAHRIIIGSSVGLVVAAVAGGQSDLYGLLAMVGGILGYIGFRWLKHVPLY